MKPKVTRRREAGWGATGDERVACRMRNSFRRGELVSLRPLANPRVRECLTGCAEVTAKAISPELIRGWGRDAPKVEWSKRRDLSAVCEAGKSQSPHSSAAAQAARGSASKTGLSQGGVGR
jgi:hypothetical protein